MTESKEDAKFFINRFWPKLIERLQIAKVAMENGMDISETDLEIIKAQHKLYHNGEIVFDSLCSLDSDVSVVQGELFGNSVMPLTDGIDVDNDGLNQIT